MPGKASRQRHFHMMEDYVLFHPEVTSNGYRVYGLLRSKIKNAEGGFPENGFRFTVPWAVAMFADVPGMSASTIRRELSGLVKAGVLRRVEDPKKGAAVWYEFVMDPGEEYGGARSVEEHEKRLSKKGKMPQTAWFREENLTDSPAATGARLRKEYKPGASTAVRPKGGPPRKAAKPAPIVETSVEPEAPTADEDSEFDIAALEEFDRRQNETRHGGGPVPTSPMIEFASELEALTCNNPEIKLRLMTGTCRRVAEAVRPALEKGWAPAMLAKRLVAELNPKIHSPESLLLSKARDLGDPPPVVDRRGSTVLVAGKALDLGGYDLGFGYGQAKAEKPVAGPAPTEEERRERLARIARKTREN